MGRTGNGYDQADDGLLLSDLLGTPLSKLGEYRRRREGPESTLPSEKLAAARWMLAELARFIHLGDGAPWWRAEAARRMLGSTEDIVVPEQVGEADEQDVPVAALLLGRAGVTPDGPGPGAVEVPPAVPVGRIEEPFREPDRRDWVPEPQRVRGFVDVQVTVDAEVGHPAKPALPFIASLSAEPPPIVPTAPSYAGGDTVDLDDEAMHGVAATPFERPAARDPSARARSESVTQHHAALQVHQRVVEEIVARAPARTVPMIAGAPVGPDMPFQRPLPRRGSWQRGETSLMRGPAETGTPREIVEPSPSVREVDRRAPVGPSPAWTALGPWQVTRWRGYAGRWIGDAVHARSGMHGVAFIDPPSPPDRSRLEATLRASLEIPHLTTTLDRGVSPDGRGFVIEPWPVGPDLLRFVASSPGGRCPWAVTARVAASLLGALGAIHSRGLVIMSVDPARIHVEGGIGRFAALPLLHRLGEGAAPLDPSYVSPWFAAPEVAFGDYAAVDARTDVWSVVALIFWMLTGQPPYGSNPERALVSVVSRPVPSLASKVHDAPIELAALVDRALAVDRGHRFFANASELCSALQHFPEFSVEPPQDRGARLDGRTVPIADMNAARSGGAAPLPFRTPGPRGR